MIGLDGNTDGGIGTFDTVSHNYDFNSTRTIPTTILPTLNDSDFGITLFILIPESKFSKSA